jgi:hypothetical protein
VPPPLVPPFLSLIFFLLLLLLLSHHQVPVVRDRKRVFAFAETPFDSFGPPTNGAADDDPQAFLEGMIDAGYSAGLMNPRNKMNPKNSELFPKPARSSSSVKTIR